MRRPRPEFLPHCSPVSVFNDIFGLSLVCSLIKALFAWTESRIDRLFFFIWSLSWSRFSSRLVLEGRVGSSRFSLFFCSLLSWAAFLREIRIYCPLILFLPFTLSTFCLYEWLIARVWRFCSLQLAIFKPMMTETLRNKPGCPQANSISMWLICEEQENGEGCELHSISLRFCRFLPELRFVNTVITAKSVSELLISKYRASYQLEMARNPGKFGWF